MTEVVYMYGKLKL